jgi:hypothetical protein
VHGLDAVFLQNLKASHVAFIGNSVNDTFNSVGDKIHRTGTAWNGGDRDRLDLPAMSQTTEVGLGVHDKLATLQVVKPPVVGHLTARGQSVVGGRDDAVLMVEATAPTLRRGSSERSEAAHARIIAYSSMFGLRWSVLMTVRKLSWLAAK